MGPRLKGTRIAILESIVKLVLQNITGKNLVLENLESEEPKDDWSFFGFELFDLLIVLIQASVIVFSIPMDSFFANSLLRFCVGTGFFVSLYFLGQTKQYALGVQAINQFHASLWFVMIVGGAIAGALVFGIFIVGSLKDLLNAVGVTDVSLLPLFAIPFGIVSLGIIPHFATRAEEKLETLCKAREDGKQDNAKRLGCNAENESLTNQDSGFEISSFSQFIRVPVWVNYSGRGMFLLAATVLLFYIEKPFEGSKDGFVMRFFLATFMLSIFYIPVRIQEMFMRKSGPYFQSLIQTIIAVAILKSSAV